MPHINQIKNSRFLTKEDAEKPLLLTIRGCQQENVALPGAPQELHWCLTFAETAKLMVLKTTNATMIASILGSQHTDDWTGRQIVAYCDPSVMMGGRQVGGLRIRAPRTPQPGVASGPRVQQQIMPPAPAPIPVPSPVEQEPEQPPFNPENDDVPF